MLVSWRRQTRNKINFNLESRVGSFTDKNAEKQALGSDGATHVDWVDWAEFGMHFEVRASLRIGLQSACVGGNDRTSCLGVNLSFEGTPT